MPKAMLKIGDPAPAFRLASTSGGDISLDDLRGQKVVLYFYPKDDTPGCTKESCDFRDNLARLSGRGVVVLGVSRDTIASHEKFKAKHGLPFDLLSDPDARVGKEYGAFGKKMMYGKPVTGTIRSTFVIDEKGRIGALWSPVRVPGHVDEVLATLSGATSSVPAASSTRKTTTGASATRKQPVAIKAAKKSSAKPAVKRAPSASLPSASKKPVRARSRARSG
jgi:peroxiredoxin Q/BCP